MQHILTDTERMMPFTKIQMKKKWWSGRWTFLGEEAESAKAQRHETEWHI